MTDNARPSSIPVPVRTSSPAAPGAGPDNMLSSNSNSKRSSLPRAVSPALLESLRGPSRMSMSSTSDRSSSRQEYGRPKQSLQVPEPGQRLEAAQKRRRSMKPRTTGGFLLPDASFDEEPAGTASATDADRRRSKILGEARRGKVASAYTRRSTPSPTADLALSTETHDMEVGLDHLAPPPSTAVSREDGARSQAGRRASRIPSPSSRSSSASLDVDSTQIVNMALNLSESRRLAARRNVSATIPPRLAPLPDSPAAGSLKQHLYQQRRTSRNISPKPDRFAAASSPRHASISSPMMAKSLQHNYDHDGSYTYQFSSSTLNRAQKAKEHIELMAQYRRLLQIVPPLTPQELTISKQSSVSPPHSPGGTSQQRQTPLGRQYNPLQYIRNRKVRARERKIVDGEVQGFNDVSRVTDWVDQAAVSTPLSGSSKLPYFPGAHEQEHNPSHIPRPVTSAGKPKRPRLDWSFDPADLLADAYWLEQDDNRSLIEDRHYVKLFPAKIDKSQRPFSPQAGAAQPPSVTSAPSENGHKDGRNSLQLDTAGVPRSTTEASFSSARNRARQKLHEIRGSHKRSESQHTYHDFLRLGRNPTSDTSDSDTDRRRRDRAGTLTATARDLLEKQVKDMMAQEAAERQNAAALGIYDETPLSPRNTGDLFSKSEQNGAIVCEGHSRSSSQINVSMQEKRSPALLPSPVAAGRASLEVPSPSKRSSLDRTPSLPASPSGVSSRRDSVHMPLSGSEMSPGSSRPTSPTRKPLSKVKHMFRDRSRERSEEKELKVSNSVEPVYGGLPFSPIDTEFLRGPGRRRSQSPISRKLPTRTTGESHKSHKSHKSMSSIKLRGDEMFPFKNLLKGGVRLDSMVRGSVSKVTDMIWKKDEDESSSSSSSSDESDEEQKRGRRSKFKVLSRESSRQREKHFLDVMPHFKSTSETTEQKATTIEQTDTDTLPSSNLALAKAQKPSRFDKLRPPRLNVPTSPAGVSRISEEMLDGPETDDINDSDPAAAENDETRDELSISHEVSRRTSRDLQQVLAGVPQSLENNKRRPSNSMPKHDTSRHWSITDREVMPRQSQLSKSELAGVRALIIGSGIRAMEISRKAHEPHPLFAVDTKSSGVQWTDVASFVPDEAALISVSQLELYPTTARILAESIDSSIHTFNRSANQLSYETVPALHQRINDLHLRIKNDLVETTQKTTDDADEVSRDLVHNQRLKVQHVVDAMEKMSRNRRRRFRWARRAVWLVVEWVLVASMWWLWAAFVLFRFVSLAGKGIWGGVKWLLWL